MTEGVNKGLLVLSAIIIFGLFLALSYLILGETMQAKLSVIFNDNLSQITGLTNNHCDNTQELKKCEVVFDWVLDTDYVRNIDNYKKQKIDNLEVGIYQREDSDIVIVLVDLATKNKVILDNTIPFTTNDTKNKVLKVSDYLGDNFNFDLNLIINFEKDIFYDDFRPETPIINHFEYVQDYGGGYLSLNATFAEHSYTIAYNSEGQTVFETDTSDSYATDYYLRNVKIGDTLTFATYNFNSVASSREVTITIK